MLVGGIASIGITIGLIYFTQLDMYAVAGVSSFVNLIRNMTFTLPATADYLGYKWNQFFPQVGRTIACTFVQVGSGLLIKSFLFFDNWIYFFISVAILGILGLTINSFLILNKEERSYLLSKIKKIKK